MFAAYVLMTQFAFKEHILLVWKGLFLPSEQRALINLYPCEGLFHLNVTSWINEKSACSAI